LHVYRARKAPQAFFKTSRCEKEPQKQKYCTVGDKSLELSRYRASGFQKKKE
jgi:hypothetical protein